MQKGQFHCVLNWIKVTIEVWVKEGDRLLPLKWGCELRRLAD